ncbi:21545_t:CDS:2, partial [Racocetra persica]
EFFEDDDFDSDADILPVPPDFSYLKHNIPFHQGFIRLPPAFPDNNISLYGLIRLFFSQTILNTILTNTNEYAQSKYADGTLAHRQFRLQLAWDFINDTLNNRQKVVNKQHLNKNSASIVSKYYKLPTIRLSGTNHYPEWRKSRVACVWCRWNAKQNDKDINEKNPPQSQIWCNKCNVALCCNISRPSCFEKYHTYIENNNNIYI